MRLQAAASEHGLDLAPFLEGLARVRSLPVITRSAMILDADWSIGVSHAAVHTTCSYIDLILRLHILSSPLALP